MASRNAAVPQQNRGPVHIGPVRKWARCLRQKDGRTGLALWVWLPSKDLADQRARRARLLRKFQPLSHDQLDALLEGRATDDDFPPIDGDAAALSGDEDAALLDEPGLALPLLPDLGLPPLGEDGAPSGPLAEGEPMEEDEDEDDEGGAYGGVELPPLDALQLPDLGPELRLPPLEGGLAPEGADEDEEELSDLDDDDENLA